MSKTILLVNLGSPDSPSIRNVRRYLNEFLMDERVIDVAWPLRRLIVGMILIRRPRQSAHAYRKIWTPAGSPLIVTSRNVQSKLQERVSMPVELAMRYQNPPIKAAMKNLVSQGADEVLLIPLFPHYAMSSYETAVERVKEVAAELGPRIRLTVQPPYFEQPDYIAALVASAGPWLKQEFDRLLFSFHGIPERHLHKSDPTKAHCLRVVDCCNTASPAHEFCYRHQCFAAVQAFAQQARLPENKYAVSFQSRLGRDPWLTPYTDWEIERLAKSGVKKLLVICPSFVADCLETLEEIGMRGRDAFLRAGGREFELIPCLNVHPLWIEALAKMAARFVAA